MALGLAAIVIARDYPYGTVTAMGPGFVPTAVAAILTALGALILLARGGDVADAGPDLDEHAEPAGQGADRPLLSAGVVRAFLAIGGAIVLFGLAIRPLGLGLTVFLAALAGGLGHPGMRWPTLVLLAAGLAVASCLVFVLLLGQEIAMLPRLG
jgi:hypothetical protein